MTLNRVGSCLKSSCGYSFPLFPSCFTMPPRVIVFKLHLTMLKPYRNFDSHSMGSNSFGKDVSSHGFT